MTNIKTMKHEFRSCDRCGSAMKYDQDDEIVLKIITEETGTKSLRTTDMCVVCVNSLIHWFGPTNPFTGRNFEKKTE